MSSDSSVRKILIYRLGSLGDTVVALPCFHLLERMFPQAERVLLTNFPVHSKAPASAAVLGESGLVHRYMRYTVGTRSPRELLRLAMEIRRYKPDMLVYLMPLRGTKAVRRDRWFFRLAGIPRIVGMDEPTQDRKHRLDPKTGLYESEAKRLAREVAELGDAHPEDLANWDLRLTDAEKDSGAGTVAPLAGRPLLVCAPGCKMQANDWEQENWRELIGRIYRRYPSYGLIMAGATEDKDVCDYAAQDWGGAKLNVAGTLSPRESAAMFSHATLFLGPDSGPKHLAACMGVPCVCVFGARDLPGVWYPPGDGHQVIYHQPECFGCQLVTCIEMQKKCIRSVTVDEVEAACVRALTVPQAVR